MTAGTPLERSASSASALSHKYEFDTSSRAIKKLRKTTRRAAE
jgi:hypothetical protein